MSWRARRPVQSGRGRARGVGVLNRLLGWPGSSSTLPPQTPPSRRAEFLHSWKQPSKYLPTSRVERHASLPRLPRLELQVQSLCSPVAPWAWHGPPPALPGTHNVLLAVSEEGNARKPELGRAHSPSLTPAFMAARVSTHSLAHSGIHTLLISLLSSGPLNHGFPLTLALASSPTWRPSPSRSFHTLLTTEPVCTHSAPSRPPYRFQELVSTPLWCSELPSLLQSWRPHKANVKLCPGS